MLCTTPVLAQEASDLWGTWKVQELIVNSPNLSQDEKERLSEMKASWEQATFTFSRDYHFAFTVGSTNNDAVFGNIKDGYWKYNPSTKIVKICDWKDQVALEPVIMIIRVEKSNAEITFYLEETPVQLKVKKS